ncbi:UNVERIFIED_CONTAM: hypothetical protein RMT77_004917 [Armadillidium vulgare]
MTELSQGEGKSAILRYISTFIYVSTLTVTIVLNGLAGPGKSPFQHATGSVSARNEICITPAGYAFSIWGLIYFLLILIAVYAVVILFRRVGIDRTWQLGGAVSVSFLLILSLNLALNISWLFAWDHEQFIASFILLFLIALTNIMALIHSARSFQNAAPRLLTTSRFDFWVGTIVLNSQAIYKMWTILACLVNLGIMIVDVAKVSENEKPIDDVANNTCIGILAFLLVVFIIYFVLEQTLFMRLKNTIFTHYLVYIWALIAIHVKQENWASHTVQYLIIANIALGVLLLILRIAFIIYRNRRNALYKTI